MKTLQEVLRALQARVPSDAQLGPVMLRIALRTGVNLKQIKPEQNGDLTTVSKVLAVVQELGYAI